MDSRILAVDDISIKSKKHTITRRATGGARGDVYSFDITFAIETENGKEPVAIVRLTDEQASRLQQLVEDRYEEIHS